MRKDRDRKKRISAAAVIVLIAFCLLFVLVQKPVPPENPLEPGRLPQAETMSTSKAVDDIDDETGAGEQGEEQDEEPETPPPP